MFEIICQTTENLKNCCLYKGWLEWKQKKTLQALTGDEYGWLGNTCITSGRQSRDLGSLPLWGEERWLLLGVLLLSTPSLFAVDFFSIFEKFIEVEGKHWGYRGATLPAPCWSSPLSLTRGTAVETQIDVAEHA